LCPWDSRFAQPIELPGGVRLASLREAIVHLVNTIPSSERGVPVVLTAAELITSAAERGGPIEFARIATLRAINRHAVREFNSDRKETTADERLILDAIDQAQRVLAGYVEPGPRNPEVTIAAVKAATDWGW
jgi:hypothetical protein